MQGGVERLKLLDGWRAISILAVLAGHLLPLGPHRWQGNDMVARWDGAAWLAEPSNTGTATPYDVTDRW